jgi:curli biogenesis system outer membrane secretion channel CsgG
MALMTMSVAGTLAGCVPAQSMRTAQDVNMAMPHGPAMEDITTPFDEALSCLRNKIPSDVFFSVGQIGDTTGKEQYADGGTGKLVTQGAGDMVQSALFRAGVSVVNRRDPNIPLAEQSWGLRATSHQIPTDFFVSGSITSLDFIPGAGAEVTIAGIGPRYRQNRILVGLDLALTNAHTGRVVANVPLQKQLFAEEIGFSANRFVSEVLTEVEFGGMEREALQFTLRQMLSYASLQLIGQILPSGEFAPCNALVAPMDAALSEGASLSLPPGNPNALAEARQMGGEIRDLLAAQQPHSAAGAGPGVAVAPAAAATQAPSSPEAIAMGNNATTFAAQAIAAGERVPTLTDLAAADAAANDAARFMALAVQALQQAAALGLGGPEGDAAATLVEKAIRVAEAVQRMVADRKAAEAPQPLAPTAAAPTAPLMDQDIRAGGAQP